MVYLKKNFKYNDEIINNIEFICFIPPKFINSYIKFIKTALTEDKEKNDILI